MLLVGEQLTAVVTQTYGWRACCLMSGELLMNWMGNAVEAVPARACLTCRRSGDTVRTVVNFVESRLYFIVGWFVAWRRTRSRWSSSV